MDPQAAEAATVAAAAATQAGGVQSVYKVLEDSNVAFIPQDKAVQRRGDGMHNNASMPRPKGYDVWSPNSEMGAAATAAGGAGAGAGGASAAAPATIPPQQEWGLQASADDLSSTNVYFSGLGPATTDAGLKAMCGKFGAIVSAKAIVDRETGQCKGYGFVMFEENSDAQSAVGDLAARGMQVRMAKAPKTPAAGGVAGAMGGGPGGQDGGMGPGGRQSSDPTNLYFANVPKDLSESALSDMLGVYGKVVSCRVLREMSGVSRGVALARMDSLPACHEIIKNYAGKILSNATNPLIVKFADGPNNNRTKQQQQRGGRFQGGVGMMGGPRGNKFGNEMYYDSRRVMPQMVDPSRRGIPGGGGMWMHPGQPGLQMAPEEQAYVAARQAHAAQMAATRYAGMSAPGVPMMSDQNAAAAMGYDALYQQSPAALQMAQNAYVQNAQVYSAEQFPATVAPQHDVWAVYGQQQQQAQQAQQQQQGAYNPRQGGKQ